MSSPSPSPSPLLDPSASNLTSTANAPLDEGNSELTSSKSQLEKAKAELKEFKAELKEAKAELKELKAELKELKAELKEAEGELEKAERKLKSNPNNSIFIKAAESRQERVNSCEQRVISIGNGLALLQTNVNLLQTNVNLFQTKCNKFESDIQSQFQSLSSASSSKPAPTADRDRISALLSLCSSLPAPSSYASSSKMWTPPKYDIIRHHRPHSRLSLPVTLVHPVFTRFVSRISSTIPMLIEREDCAFVVDVCSSMSGDFSDESLRTKAFSEILNIYLGNDLHTEGINIPSDDGGHCSTEASIKGKLPHFPGLEAFLLNREDKNEKGHGGSDSYLQNTCYYAKYYGQRKYKDLIAASCCPTFLVELVGPSICISGAVFHEFISVDPLTPMMHLFFLPHNPFMTQLARVFKALKIGLLELKKYYENLQPLPKSSVVLRSLSDPLCYPYSNSFFTPDQEIRFNYTHAVASGNGRVFGGEITSIENKGHNDIDIQINYETKFNSPPSIGTAIIIKFVRRYGIDGHLLLSRRSPPLAPQLYSVESIGADWLMIVMEKISNAQPCPNPLSQTLALRLRETVTLLHSRNLVHGDIRSNNLLVLDDGINLRLIDFDWCGKEDEDVYPYFMNGVDIPWAKGASDGQKLKRSHDIYMMNRIIGGNGNEESISTLENEVSSLSISPI